MTDFPSSEEERLERLLARRHEYVGVGELGATSAIVRRDSLAVPVGHADQVQEALGSRYDGAQVLDRLRIARIRVRNIDRGEQLSDFVRTSAPAADLVHLLRGKPDYHGGPASLPTPVEEFEVAPYDPQASHPTVAVLDTGMTRRHEWFGQRVWEAVAGLESWDELDSDNDYALDAQAGHGTAVAGVVRQGAPASHLLVGRVLGADGVCDELELVAALRAVRDHAARTGQRVDVLNLSLGGYTHDDRPSRLVTAALGEFDNATVVVAAAGNAGSDRPMWPAALPSVVGVGAEDAHGARTPWSNYGTWVNTWAPGSAVPTSFVSWRDDTGPRPAIDIDAECLHGFVAWSGTSFAAPAVAARIADLMQVRGLTAREAEAELLGDDASQRPGTPSDQP